MECGSLLSKPRHLIRYKLFRLAHPYSEPNSFGMSLPSNNGKSWAFTTAYSQITKESGGSFKLHAGPWVANTHPAHPLEFFFFSVMVSEIPFREVQKTKKDARVHASCVAMRVTQTIVNLSVKDFSPNAWP